MVEGKEYSSGLCDREKGGGTEVKGLQKERGERR